MVSHVCIKVLSISVIFIVLQAAGKNVVAWWLPLLNIRNSYRLKKFLDHWSRFSWLEYGFGATGTTGTVIEHITKTHAFQWSVYIFSFFVFFVVLFYFYGIQLVRQLFYLYDRHFQFKIILMYNFYYSYMLKVWINFLSIYIVVSSSCLTCWTQRCTSSVVHSGTWDDSLCGTSSPIICSAWRANLDAKMLVLDARCLRGSMASISRNSYVMGKWEESEWKQLP